MNTYEPVLRRGVAGWDREKVPREMLEERLGRIRAAMRAREFAVLVLHGDCWKYGDLAYATHYAPMTREGVALIPLEGEPLLYLSLGSRDIPFHRELTWIDEVFPLPLLIREMAGRLRGWGAAGKNVGLVGVLEDMRASLFEDLRAQAGDCPLVSCTDWYRGLRLRKDPRETDLIREAAGVADRCLEEIRDRLRPGVKEFELAAEADYIARRLGAEETRILLTSGPDADRFLRRPGGRSLAPGEKILVYLALSRQHYWTELGRTLFVGEPAAMKAAVLEETLQIYERLLKSAGPDGKGPSRLEAAGAAFRAHLDQQHASGYAVLQGIGLDREEAPRIDLSLSPSPLLPGTSLSLRLAQFSPGVGALFSETLVVHPERCEILAQADRRGFPSR